MSARKTRKEVINMNEEILTTEATEATEVTEAVEVLEIAKKTTSNIQSKSHNVAYFF